MNRPTLFERGAFMLARMIVGPERGRWMDALEAELAELESGRLSWAFGSVIVAIKDRVTRERRYLIALGIAPAATLALLPALSTVIIPIARLTGLNQLQLMPLIALAPFSGAFLLGALRVRRHSVATAIFAFAAYQSIPVLALSLMTHGGMRAAFLWEPNLSAYGILPPVGAGITLALWVAGVASGAHWARRRSRAG